MLVSNLPYIVGVPRKAASLECQWHVHYPGTVLHEVQVHLVHAYNMLYVMYVKLHVVILGQKYVQGGYCTRVRIVRSNILDTSSKKMYPVHVRLTGTSTVHTCRTIPISEQH